MPRLTSLLLLACGAAACGPGDDGNGEGCAATLLAGDLVIAEIQGNPEGDDTGQEWFEIYNRTSGAVDLAGLTLVTSRTDGTDEKGHAIAAGMVGAGEYFVVGDLLDALRPAWVDYGYGNDLGALRNEAGRLALRCGATVIDETVYDVMDTGKAHQLSGASPPDYLANDDLVNWCEATNEYTTGNFGTPGEQNGACGGGPLPTECLDGGTMRAIVAPAAGDLVITEIMPNPMLVADTAGEWFEVFVMRDVDLNGLELGNTPGDPKTTIVDANCVRAAGGTYLVFARNTDMTMNGGLPAPVVATPFTFGLTNSGGSLFVGLGGQVLDQVTWATSFDGAATGLDPTRTTTMFNDDPLNWCKATAPYGLGDDGSPGAANPMCPITLPPGMCQAGMIVRAIDPAAGGDVVITELMANPSAVADAEGEWFEVLVTRDLDLNGLELGTTPPTVRATLTSADCLSVTAGSYVLFARNDDMTMNGGLPAVSFVFNYGVVNSGSGLFVGIGGTVLDAVTWTSTAAGASTSLDPDFTDPVGNDTAANFCNGTTAYGAGDLGTPATANPQCM